MASLYGDFVAKTVTQTSIRVVATEWTPLVVDTSPLGGRRHLRIQAKSNPGGAIALAYASKNADGTFTTPTDSVGATTVMPGNTTWVEPIGDAIQVFGRLQNKAGETGNHVRCVVTEYA